MTDRIAVWLGSVSPQRSIRWLDGALETAATGWFWDTANGGTLWIKVGGDQLATIDP